MIRFRPSLLAPLLLAACTPHYTLVSAAPAPGAVAVAGSGLRVHPTDAWNRAPHAPGEPAWQETWTRNGPLLDTVTFMAGVPDGKEITRQRRRDDARVPVFHADMSPQDLASMVEALYRIKGGAGVFETQGVAPIAFLSGQGLRIDFGYVGEQGVPRQGRAVLAVHDGRLFAMILDSARSHYFAAAAPEFDAMVSGASVG